MFMGDESKKYDKYQFHRLVVQIDPRVTIKESQGLFEYLDSDNDGTLTFGEFKKMFCETDYSDLNDRGGQILTDLREIVRNKKLDL